MRKLFIIPVVLFTALVACNSGTNNKGAADSTNISTSTQNIANAAVAPLPAIPAGAKVYFKNIKDGETVSSPLKIEFGVDNMTVTKKAPVGKIAEGIGHHHLLIDAGDSIPAGTIIPEDSTHIHYGGGQTEGTVTLAPGKHTLTLQFGDAIHRSYGSALASTVTVNVK
ncbi:DUF4399 domain-containing protein [Arachidicoccus sp.]|jgi:hypothetical protein|uniref:DUF4399 domain-containing protein n=1 Tax=Arachidicoccus sp. TaxID=1872624 RepID=UPI003D262762